MVAVGYTAAAGATERLLVAVEAKTGLARKRAGREWALRCPCHEDRSPSLNVREGNTGAPIAICRVCDARLPQVIEAVGLEWSDLFPRDDTPWGMIVDRYPYRDEGGELLYEVLRCTGREKAKEFPVRRPDASKPDGWAWGMGDKKVLYRLPELLEGIRAGKRVWIAEGEKDVDALRELGEVATCNPGGAGPGKWRNEYALALASAEVSIIVDKDLPDPKRNGVREGIEHGRAIAATLQGIAKSVRIVQTPVEKKGADVSDHLSAGLTLDQLVPAGLEAVDLSGEPELGPDSPDVTEAADEPQRPRLVFLRGDEFIAQPIMRSDPLVGTEDDALLMPGSLAILAGIGGAGKTTLSLHMLAHWASGLPWFGIATRRPIRLVVIENEGPHDPYVKKVREFAERFVECPCGDGHHGDGPAFLENCHFLDAPWGHFSFDDPGLADELRAFVRDTEADLVVANPLGRLGMKGAGTPEETRSFLQLLFNAGLNEDFGALLLHHFSMPRGGHTPIVQRLSGDWGPHPDLILALEPDGERKSKLSFGKVRWGDQGRPPLLLEWLTDPAGPVGYTGQSAPTGLDDFVIFGRIDSYLAAQKTPVGATEVRKSVKGNNKRLSELLLKGVETGRYLSTGGLRPEYRLAPDVVFDDEPSIDYQADLFEEEG